MTETQFQEILLEAMNEEYKWIPNPEDLQYDYTFSKKFEKKMKKMMLAYGADESIEKRHTESSGKNEYVWIGRHAFRRMRVIILVAVLVLALVACTAYVGITWNEKQNDEQGTLDVEFEIADSDDASGEFEYKRPKVPDGFAITAETKYPDMLKLEYMNEENAGIDYIQQSGIDTMGLSIDNDDESFTEITVNGYKGYARMEGTAPYMTWSDGKYLYYLSGNVSFDLLREMAESVK